MAFAVDLHESFDRLDSRLNRRFGGSERLEHILDEYLLEVEAASDRTILTSILLLDASGEHLLHGAAPSLPDAYCHAIHGNKIGPGTGSCGTAAFVGHSIYVTDIARDPLWKDFRSLALSHDLQACWSTPIFDEPGNMLGTFAIYYPTPRAPTIDEIDAVKAISERVARAVTTHR